MILLGIIYITVNKKHYCFFFLAESILRHTFDTCPCTLPLAANDMESGKSGSASLLIAVHFTSSLLRVTCTSHTILDTRRSA